MKIKDSVTDQDVEVSVVCFRARYTSTDYLTQTQFDVRLLLERSCAIKYPTIQLQLAVSKKVQQVLTKPGVLQSFLLGHTRWDGPDSTEEDVGFLRGSWMGMWRLDEGRDGGVGRAMFAAETFVMKPQREGGGHSVYKFSTPGFLDTQPSSGRGAWVATEWIEFPKGMNSG